MKGWIYFAINESLPELIKIGFSDRHPEFRMNELSNTSVPTPFIYAYGALCENAEKIERQMHRELSNYRISVDREFFRIDLQTAVDTLRQITENENLKILLEEQEVQYDDSKYTMKDTITENENLKILLEEQEVQYDDSKYTMKDTISEIEAQINVVSKKFKAWKERSRLSGNESLYDDLVTLEVEFKNYSSNLTKKELIEQFTRVVNMTQSHSWDQKKCEISKLVIQKCERDLGWFKRIMGPINSDFAYIPKN